MSLIKLIVVVLLYKVYVCGDYSESLTLAIESKQVRILPTETRKSITYNVDIDNGLPNLVIFCYAPGKVQRSLTSVWRTVTFNVNTSGEVTLYNGYDEDEVYNEWIDSSRIVSWILPWKVNSLTVSPFNHSCIGIRLLSEEISYDVSLTISAVNWWLVACLLVGILLFFSAKRFSSNVVFYYGTGVSFGLLASVLIIIFIISRFIPKKSAAFALLGVGFSLTAWLLQYLWQNIQELLASYIYYFALYFFTAGLMSFAICYYKGPVTNPRLLDLIKWSIQLVAILLIYFSSQIAEVSFTIVVFVVLISFIPRQFLQLRIPPFLLRFWRRRFPPKIRLLTEEEYIMQGVEETKKALEELRQFCRSPQCNAWKTISRLNSPVQCRFVDWIEGNSDHVTNDEFYQHEHNSSPLLPLDTDDD